jgi:hypothetical protein
MAACKETSTSEGTDEATTQDLYGFGAPSSFDLLATIFRYLSAKDLSSCRSVCRTWLEASDHTAAVRPAFEWTRRVFHKEDYEGLFIVTLS